MGRYEELIQKIRKSGMPDEYYLELEKEVREYLHSGAPDKEKRLLRFGDAEGLYILCAGIRRKQQNKGN
ncbi:MAG: hypothetical protein K2I96_12235 [Lachnospiraceae bacterium]|nr:hypothetical protein [Lachnospiraceae bacterium]